MLATYTLATTNFAAPVAKLDTQVNLVSTTGIVPGIYLFAARELMKVVALTGIGNNVNVLRGRDGTVTESHSPLETVYLAQGYQIFMQDPQGVPGVGAVLAN